MLWCNHVHCTFHPRGAPHNVGLPAHLVEGVTEGRRPLGAQCPVRARRSHSMVQWQSHQVVSTYTPLTAKG
eukprot:12938113-Alexandrium_andersonii.AAC.1